MTHDEPSFRTRYQIPGHARLGHELAFSAIASSLRFHSGWTGYTELGNQCPLSRPARSGRARTTQNVGSSPKREITHFTQIPLARSLPRSSLCQPYFAFLIIQIWLTPEYGWLSMRFQAAPMPVGGIFRLELIRKAHTSW